MGVTTRMPSILEQEHTGGLRGSIRFPISVPVRLMVNGQEYEAKTENMSASGVLLRLDTFLEVGTQLDFLVEVPAGALGLKESAAVHCTGRVIRAYRHSPNVYAAAVIDEYSFQ
jgi:PilZ domain